MAAPQALRLYTSEKTHYSFRGPKWDLRWTVDLKGDIVRHCYLYDMEGNQLDPMISEHGPLIDATLGELVQIIHEQFMAWSDMGDDFCETLLETKNLPSYLVYARRVLGFLF